MPPDSTQLPPALRARLATDPLWEFALAFYGRDDVAATCLRLQDEAGVDVCELLWRCWLFRHGVALTGEPAALKAVWAWQREVTAPLRRLRRQLKTAASHDAGVARVRRDIQQAELAAEREALARLQRLTLDTNHLPLKVAHQRLVESIGEALQLQKKAHLLALEMLESQLDPLGGPR